MINIKIKLNKFKLKKIIEEFNYVIDQANYFHEYKGILFKAKNKEIEIIGCSDTIFLKKKISIENNFKEEISFLINYFIFKNAINKLKEDIIEIEIDDQKNLLTLKENNGKISLNLLDKKIYPKIDFKNFKKGFWIENKKLKKCIKNIIFASSYNNPDLFLNCVNLKKEKNTLTLFCSDSFRLSKDELKIESNEEDFQTLIISKSLKNIMSLDFEEKINIKIEEDKIFFQDSFTVAFTKIVDSFFVSFEKIFPDENVFEIELEIEKDEFYEMLSKVSIISTEKNNSIKLKVNENLFLISAFQEEIGFSEFSTDKFRKKGKDFEILFNYKYLKEALIPFENKIYLKFTNNLDKMIIKSKEEKNNLQIISSQGV